VTTNPGHGLYCDLIDRSKAGALAERLMAAGHVQRVGDPQPCRRRRSPTNPMSYHKRLGLAATTTALVAAGPQALRAYGGLDAADRHGALRHRPCTWNISGSPNCSAGSPGGLRPRPSGYPVGPAPRRAWAAASPFLLPPVDARHSSARGPTQGLVTVNKPALPEWLKQPGVAQPSRVGDSRLSLVFTRQGER